MEIEESERSGRMRQWELEAEPELIYAEDRAQEAVSALRGD